MSARSFLYSHFPQLLEHSIMERICSIFTPRGVSIDFFKNHALTLSKTLLSISTLFASISSLNPKFSLGANPFGNVLGDGGLFKLIRFSKCHVARAPSSSSFISALYQNERSHSEAIQKV